MERGTCWRRFRCKARRWQIRIRFVAVGVAGKQRPVDRRTKLETEVGMVKGG